MKRETLNVAAAYLVDEKLLKFFKEINFFHLICFTIASRNKKSKKKMLYLLVKVGFFR